MSIRDFENNILNLLQTREDKKIYSKEKKQVALFKNRAIYLSEFLFAKQRGYVKEVNSHSEILSEYYKLLPYIFKYELFDEYFKNIKDNRDIFTVIDANGRRILHILDEKSCIVTIFIMNKKKFEKQLGKRFKKILTNPSGGPANPLILGEFPHSVQQDRLENFWHHLDLLELLYQKLKNKTRKKMFTFGPVNSRRFGLSLGIDLSPLKKSCNYDCVYCELTASKPVDSIENPPAVEEVIKEVKEALLSHDSIEVITITSNGEPTLYPDLDKLVDELNKIKMDKKLLILSNGSTICDKNIKSTLEKLDFVKLSLDCATSKCFKKIDRPLKDIELDKIISCMKDIKTTLIIEILLVQGINDKESEIEAINQVLQEIKPDRVDIGTIDRPPAYDVKKVDEDKLVELSKLIKNIPVSVIRKNPPSQKQDFTKEELLNLLSHRPQSQFDVDTFFSKSAKKVLDELYHNEKVMKKDIAGTIFYQLS